jgi:RimJ/RimL family protein N-acetyltransferase
MIPIESPSPSPIPTLVGERVRLRPYRAGDRDALFALYSDPVVARYWSFPPWTDVAQADAYLAPVVAQVDGGPQYSWVIGRASDDAMIGTTTLFSIRRDQLRAELGYSLARTEHGKGLASEAVRLALGFAFETLGLERIEADVDPRNAASCRMLERLGFQREGLLRARWRVAGEVSDSVIFGLLRADQRVADAR